jgi:hypothetical protein
VCQYDVAFSFEDEDSTDGMKALILDEVHLFREEVRNLARGWEAPRGSQQYVWLPSAQYALAPG